MADKRNLELFLRFKDSVTSGLNKVRREFALLDKGVNNLKKVFAGGILGLGVKELLQSAADLESIGGAYNNLAGQFGINSEEMLNALRATSVGTISDYDLMLSANKAMVLGVAKSTQEFTGLMTFARAAATEMGISTQQAFDNLATGIGRNSILILDNLGISTAFIKKSMREYATSIGKAVDELDDFEKKQALTNAVIEAGKEKMEGINPEILSNAERLAQLQASSANLRAELGKQLLPVFGGLSEQLSDTNNRVGGTRGLVKAFKILLDVFTIVGKGLSVLLTGFVAFGATIKDIGVLLANIWKNPIQAIRKFDTNFQGSVDAVMSSVESLKTSFSEFGQVEDVDMQAEALLKLKDNATSAQPELNGAKEEVDKLAEASSKLFEKLDSGFSKTIKDIKKLQQEMQSLTVNNVKENLSINQELAKQFVDQEKRVADLQGEFNRETNSDKKEELRERLEFEKKELQKFSTIEMAFSNEVSEVRRRNGLSEIARAVEDLNMKRILINQEFDAKKNAVQQEINLEKEKFSILSDLLKKSVQEQDKANAIAEKQTVESVNARIKMFNRLASAASAAMSGRQTGFVSVGAGTEARATQSIGSVNITINGDVSGQELVEKVKNQITSGLRLNFKGNL